MICVFRQLRLFFQFESVVGVRGGLIRRLKFHVELVNHVIEVALILGVADEGAGSRGGFFLAKADDAVDYALLRIEVSPVLARVRRGVHKVLVWVADLHVHVVPN